jgi:AcrR family transcriptional regulator
MDRKRNMEKTASIRKPKQKRSINTKEKILDTAYKLFCEKGYYSTTTNEIARVADVSIGSLYSYFKDKDTIFLEILGRYSNAFMEIHEELSQTLESSSLNLREWMHQLIIKLIDMHVSTRELNQEINILCYTMPEVKAHIEKRREASRQLALNHLLRTKEVLRVTDIEAAAIVSFNLISSTVDQVAFESNLIEKERMINATLDALERYLLK